MLNLLKNKVDRILNKKEIIVISVLVVPIMISVAVFFTEKPKSKEVIAFVDASDQVIPESSQFKIERVNETPKISDLALGEYSAIVKMDTNKKVDVITLKSEYDKENIQKLFESGSVSSDYKSEEELLEERGVGTNILGFVLMLILIQGVALSTLFPEDKLLKTFRRILTSPVGVKKYLLTQGIFTFSFVYIPTFIAIVVTKVCFGVNIGFSIGTLAILLAIISAFGTSFGLFMSSILEKNINLITSAITIITCILSGCFISFSGGNRVFDLICNIIPQKSYMTLVHGVEMGQGILEYRGELAYLFCWTICLLLIGSIVIKRKVKAGEY